jgi:hypothetical protein
MHDTAALHGHVGGDVADTGFLHGERIGVQDREVGELAGLERALLVLVEGEIGAVRDALARAARLGSSVVAMAVPAAPFRTSRRRMVLSAMMASLRKCQTSSLCARYYDLSSGGDKPPNRAPSVTASRPPRGSL